MLSIAMLKTYKSEVRILEETRVLLMSSNQMLGKQIAELDKLNPNFPQLPKLKEVLAFGQKRELEMKTTVTLAMAQINHIETMTNPDAFESMLEDLRKAGGL